MKINRKAKANVYINVAPLVEVMLVLVIIFMITAPTLNVGVQVNLPKTQAASLNNAENSSIKPLIISINKFGQIYLDDIPIDLNALITKTKIAKVVYVRGDEGLPYGKIMEIMGILSTSGDCKVSLISEHQQSQVNRG
ncbi:MAG: biopolymer transporter ExbD [Alphaproteobacteria bacterium]|nr:biopolymer transporter ExbD [Alphaproteobacteria bacterium]